MELLKLWPVLLAVVAVFVAVVKLLYQVQKSLDWQKEVAPRFVVVEKTVERLAGVPERLGQLEKKVDRLTPRMRELARVREDLDSLDDDVSGVREAMLTRRSPPPRARRSPRTPPTGVPIALPEDQTEANDREDD